MRLLKLFLKTSWQNVVLAILTSLMSGASIAGLIALSNISLTKTQVPKSILAVAFISLCLLIVLTTAPSQIFVNKLGQRIIFDLRMRFTKSILACPLRGLEEIGTPTLLASLTEDVEVISKASVSLSILCLNVAILIGCMLHLMWLSIKIFLFLLVYLFLGFLFGGLLMRKGKRFFQLAREQQDRLLAHFQTTTEGIKELKLHYQRRLAFIHEDLQATAATYRRYQLAAVAILATLGSLVLVMLFIPIGLLLFVPPSLTTISPNTISGFVLTMVFMLMPLQMMIAMLTEFMRANVALNKIDSLQAVMTAQITEPEISLSSYLQPQHQKLELDGITHAYQRDGEVSQFIVGPIDLILYPGELVFIVGGNGSGKSTLVKLLAGLYIPETGTIRLGGETITDANREWYRQHFSAIFSDFYLFDRLLGFEGERIDKRTQYYLKHLQLDKKVQVKDGHFSTLALSQGQRKRLALLTAYLEDRPIYIFDEWASDQDPSFKQIFYTQLVPELKQRSKTVFVISHDDHYFHLADRIIKLDSGRIEYDQYPVNLPV